jgi:hypothetical protein
VPALLQAFVRLVALKRLGVLLFVLAATLCASSTASALEPAQTKTRVWGFDLAAHNSCGLLSAANSGKHQGNRLALSEVVSGSLLAAEGAGALSEGVASDARLFQQYRAELAAQEIEGADAVGSALKADPYHRSASFVTDMAREGKVFSIGNRSGTVNLTQVLGEMNGVSGRFEWIVDGSGNLTHQMFVRGGGITGVPIVP